MRWHGFLRDRSAQPRRSAAKQLLDLPQNMLAPMLIRSASTVVLKR